MSKYRTVVDAVKYEDGMIENPERAPEWLAEAIDRGKVFLSGRGEPGACPTIMNVGHFLPGWYIIRSLSGDLSASEPEEFEAVSELMDEGGDMDKLWDEFHAENHHRIGALSQQSTCYQFYRFLKERGLVVEKEVDE